MRVMISWTDDLGHKLAAATSLESPLESNTLAEKAAMQIAKGNTKLC